MAGARPTSLPRSKSSWASNWLRIGPGSTSPRTGRRSSATSWRSTASWKRYAELQLPHCVASRGTHAKMRRTLGRPGCCTASRAGSSARRSRHGKPAPICSCTPPGRSAPHRTCAVVEDSAHGVQAARSAGMHVFAYAGGVTPAERLEGPGTTVFSDMRQIPDSSGPGGPRPPEPDLDAGISPPLESAPGVPGRDAGESRRRCKGGESPRRQRDRRVQLRTAMAIAM